MFVPQWTLYGGFTVHQSLVHVSGIFSIQQTPCETSLHFLSSVNPRFSWLIHPGVVVPKVNFYPKQRFCDPRSHRRAELEAEMEMSSDQLRQLLAPKIAVSCTMN